MKNKNYCTNCAYRIEKVFYKKGERFFSDTPLQDIKTNKSNFCAIGYTQNPTTRIATLNAISTGAKICDRNPFKKDKQRGNYLFNLDIIKLKKEINKKQRKSV